MGKKLPGASRSWCYVIAVVFTNVRKLRVVFSDDARVLYSRYVMEAEHPNCSARLANSELTQGNIIGDHGRYKGRKLFYRIDLSSRPGKPSHIAWYLALKF